MSRFMKPTVFRPIYRYDYRTNQPVVVPMPVSLTNYYYYTSPPKERVAKLVEIYQQATWQIAIAIIATVIISPTQLGPMLTTAFLTLLFSHLIAFASVKAHVDFSKKTYVPGWIIFICGVFKLLRYLDPTMKILVVYEMVSLYQVLQIQSMLITAISCQALIGGRHKVYIHDTAPVKTDEVWKRTRTKCFFIGFIWFGFIVNLANVYGYI